MIIKGLLKSFPWYMLLENKSVTAFLKVSSMGKLDDIDVEKVTNLCAGSQDP